MAQGLRFHFLFRVGPVPQSNTLYLVDRVLSALHDILTKPLVRTAASVSGRRPIAALMNASVPRWSTVAHVAASPEEASVLPRFLEGGRRSIDARSREWNLSRSAARRYCAGI